MGLPELIEKYAELFCSPTARTKDEAKKIGRLESKLKKEHISLIQTKKNRDAPYAPYVLTLPLTIRRLNALLKIPENEGMRDDEYLFLRADLTTQYLSESGLSEIGFHIDEYRGKTRLSFDNINQAIGFMKAYAAKKAESGMKE